MQLQIIHSFIKGLRFPFRILVMIPILLSLLWEYQTASGLTAAVFGGAFGVICGEFVARSRLRATSIVALGLLCSVLAVVMAFVLTHFAVFSSLFGPTMTLRLHAILLGGLITFAIVGVLRSLAQRHKPIFALEFWLMALSCAYAFAPHRDQVVLQPLWLSDMAWRYGLDPTAVLGAIGAVLALVLAVLTLLEKTRKIPVTVILLPLLALLALIFIDPSKISQEDPPKSNLDKLLKDFQGKSDRFMRGGQSSPDEKGYSGKKDKNKEGNPEKAFDQDGDGSGGGQAHPIAVVLLENDYNPPSQYYYLRQETFSEFTGVRLVQSLSKEIPYDGIRGFPVQPVDVETKPPVENRMEIKGKVALLTPHTAPFGIESLLRYEPTINPRPSTFVRTYAFVSSAPTLPYEQMIDYEVGEIEWSDVELEHYTTKHPDPRYGELAAQIVEGIPEKFRENPFAKALSVKLFLDAKTKYTRRVRHANAADPTASYLFGPQNQYIGYCVHTAHAAAFLWRELGIPSRIGVGYAIEAQNRRGDGLLVTNADAHAWPEIYLQDVGWVALDIAPSQNLDAEGQRPDEKLAESLFELARNQEQSEFRQPIDWRALWKVWRPIIYSAIALLSFALLVGHYFFKIYRRYRPQWEQSPRVIYISVLDRLSEAGLQRKFGESREDFARRIHASMPSFTTITDGHLAEIFGVDTISPDPLLQAWKHNAQELRKSVPWWRRLLGIINPFSFYTSR